MGAWIINPLGEMRSEKFDWPMGLVVWLFSTLPSSRVPTVAAVAQGSPLLEGRVSAQPLTSIPRVSGAGEPGSARALTPVLDQRLATRNTHTQYAQFRRALLSRVASSSYCECPLPRVEFS